MFYGSILYHIKFFLTGLVELTGLSRHVSFDWLKKVLREFVLKLFKAVLLTIDTIVILIDIRCIYWMAIPRNIENDNKKRHDIKNEGSIKFIWLFT